MNRRFWPDPRYYIEQAPYWEDSLRARLILILVSAAAIQAAPVTYFRDVVPVLQNRCQGCHRPGEVAPGQAKLIRAGSDLIFQIHYTPNGKPGTDRSRFGLIFSKEPPRERVHSLTITNVKLLIPPGVADYPVQADFSLPRDVKLVSLNPHMHLRGKSFDFRAVYPTGESEVLLRVPNYNFFWQLYYYLAEQKTLPNGTRIECTGHYDNSPNNPNNPDPRAEVRWGDQSWEEMLVGTMDVAIPPQMDLMDLYPRKKTGAD